MQIIKDRLTTVSYCFCIEFSIPKHKDGLTLTVIGYFFQVDDGNNILDTSAVQFCARKVSAMAGDMRKALDICR